jgi:hypothetical protein
VSNANTVRRQVSGTQQLTTAPSLNPGTTETNFVLNNNGLTLTGGGVIPLAAGNTGLYAGTGQVLNIRAAGSYSGLTAADTITLKLYEVSAATIAAGGLTQTSQTNFVLVASSGALAAANAAGAFQFEASIQLDAAGNLNGDFTANVDGTTKAQAAISAVTGLVGEADLNFVLSATFSASRAGSIITLNEFAIDLQ